MEILLLWILVMVGLGALLFPVAAIVFRDLPDSGWSFLKPLALLLLAYFTWIPASLHLVPVGYGVLLAILLLAGVFLWALSHDKESILSSLTKRRHEILLSEGLFLVLFIAFVWIRSFNPPIEGQEKFMDFALLNSMLRSTTMPPPDPWLSDFTVNYYYYGYFLWSLPVRISHIPSGIGYTLVLSTIAAATCQGAYGVGRALANSRAAGWVAAFFIGIVGNLDGALQLRQGGSLLDGLDYWRSSRVVENTINEFPYFSFIHGDIHPHVMALPFVLMLIALTFTLWPSSQTKEKSSVSWLTWIITTLTVGVLLCMNVWDFPAYTGILLLAMGYRTWRMHSGEPLGMTIVGALGRMGLVVFGAYLLYLPFQLNYVPPQYSEEGLLGWAHAQTPLSKLLIIYGLFFFAVLSAVVMNFLSAFRNSPQTRDLLGIGTACLFTVMMLLHFENAPWLSAQIFRNGTTALMSCCLIVLILTTWRKKGDVVPFYWVLSGGGFFLILLCELIYLRDPYGEQFHRMNTIFKFYYQAWILLAIAASAATADVMKNLLSRAKSSVQGKGVLAAWSGALAALIISASAYTVGATITRANHFRTIPTLDGTAYMTRDHGDDYAVIKWLNQYVSGSPVLLEATGDPYSYFARMASYTGLPTVLGWANHEDVWRAGTYGIRETIAHRRADIDAIYGDPIFSTIRPLLDQYQIRYVFVGELERSRYSDQNLMKFSGALKEAYRYGESILYEVPATTMDKK